MEIIFAANIELNFPKLDVIHSTAFNSCQLALHNASGEAEAEAHSKEAADAI